MKKVLPKAWRARFEAAAEISPKSGVMFWHAREVMNLLGYSPRAVLKPVVARAIAAADEAGRDTDAHFLTVERPGVGKAAPTADYRLTRFGALMMAQTAADDDRDEVAYGRLYFAEPAPAPKPVVPEKKAAAAVTKAPAKTKGKTTAKVAVEPAPATKRKKAPATKSAAPAQPASKTQAPAKVKKAPKAKPAAAKKPAAPKPEVAPNSWQAALERKRTAEANPAKRVGKVHGAAQLNLAQNPRMNQNLAYGRGYPNTAARNAR